MGGSAERPIERLAGRRRAAALAKSLHRQNPDRPVERHRHHVLDPHRMARGRDTLTVDADEAAGHQSGCVAARAHHPRMPEPFVDALTIGRRGLRRGSDRQTSIPYCFSFASSSCCLSAASFANGELGSATFSRRGGADETNMGRLSGRLSRRSPRSPLSRPPLPKSRLPKSPLPWRGRP